MGVKAGYKLRDRVEGDVGDDMRKEKSNGIKRCTGRRIHMCMCARAGLAHVLI